MEHINRNRCYEVHKIGLVQIDVTFDFRTDSRGKDPDNASSSLKAMHAELWSKPLPNGEILQLSDKGPGPYLTYEGRMGKHFLSSDSIANSYGNRKRLSSLLNEIEPSLISSFRNLNSTLGAFIVFPGNRINGKATINGERGFNNLIADRFDLTLECIRRHYLGTDSPLEAVLNRYSDFFSLFDNFKSYVDFFLLNDLVSNDYSVVRYFNSIPEVFVDSPVPDSVESYLMYREGSMAFVTNRNLRIEKWAKNGQ